MSRYFHRFGISSAILAAFLFVGCGGPDSKAGKGGEGGEHDHAHDHPAEGPHGGHLIELGEEEYHGEWLHDEDGKITVYILDGTAKKTYPIPAEKVVIATKKDDKTDTYELPAVDRTTGDNPTAFKFETVDKELLGKLETVGEARTATLQVTIGGKDFEGKIEKHEEHAGHKH